MQVQFLREFGGGGGLIDFRIQQVLRKGELRIGKLCVGGELLKLVTNCIEC